MCNPAAAAIIQVAAAAATAYGQQQQSKVQTRVAENNTANARRAQLDGLDAQAAQGNQAQEVANRAATTNAINAAKARANINAVAAESGVSGLSIDALVNDVSRQEATNYETLAANQAHDADQRYRVAQGDAAATQSRINSVQPGQFSAALAAIQIAGAGASAYGNAGGFGK